MSRQEGFKSSTLSARGQGPELAPLVVAAAKEVDVTLLDWALSLTPRERLRASSRAERALKRFVDAPPENG